MLLGISMVTIFAPTVKSTTTFAARSLKENMNRKRLILILISTSLLAYLHGLFGSYLRDTTK